MGKHNKTKEKKKKKKSGSKIFVIILIILLILGIWFAKKMYDLDGNWLAVLMGHNKNTVKNLEKLDILILGESTGSTDTIIICRYDPKTGEAGMLSIPRDTFIGDNPSQAKAHHKINSLYMSNGEGPQKMLEAVNKVTGLEIKNYIEIDTQVLIEMVELIGGLEFDVPIDMKYDDYSQDLHIDLQAGYQKLSGKQVEWLVRFRHDNYGNTYPYEYGIEDYGRMRTQRAVIKALASQTIKLKNVKEIGNIIDILEQYVETNMDFKKIKDYIPYAVNINMDLLQAEQLPGVSEKLNGIWFFLPDKEETPIIVDKIFNTIEEEPVEEDANEITE